MSRPDTEAVAIGYLHSNDVSYSWHVSLMSLVAHDLEHQGRVLRGGWMAMKPGTGGIIEGRNQVVHQFLHSSDVDWLLWLDTDMGFPPDTVDRLLEVADPVTRPVVGALCFAYKEVTSDGLGGHRAVPRPTVYDWVTEGEEQGFRGRTVYPLSHVVPFAGTG